MDKGSLQQDLWLNRLSDRSLLPSVHVERLIEAFCEQLKIRLERGESVVQKGVGYWTMESRSEFVAILPETKHILIPPCIHLRITRQLPKGRIVLEETMMSALSTATGLLVEACDRWWRALVDLLREDLTDGRRVDWPHIGSFQKHEDKIVFSPAGEVSSHLNRAFSVFPLTELDTKQRLPDTEYRIFESLDSALDTSSILTISNGKGKDSQHTSIDTETFPLRECIGITQGADPLSFQEASSATSDRSSVKHEIRDEQPLLAPQLFVPLSTGDVLSDASLLSAGSVVEGERRKANISVSTDLEDSSSDVLPRRSLGKKCGVGLLVAAVLLLLGAVIYLLSRSRPNDHGSVSGQGLASSLSTQRSLSLQSDAHSLSKETSETNPEGGMGRESVPENVSVPTSEVERWVTIRQGERLNQVALRAYGSKVFWVYIYRANRDRIVNPDRISAGLKLRLPKLEEFGVTNDSAGIRLALRVEREWNLKKSK